MMVRAGFPDNPFHIHLVTGARVEEEVLGPL